MADYSPHPLNLDSHLELLIDDSTDQVPHIYGLQFHWDNETLNQMEPSLSLEISQDLRVVLRYYLLLEEDMPLYCGLNFISTYNGVRVIGSEICLNGQIINQVRQDFLEQTELLDKITNGHHLLMQEMLAELSLVNYRQGINNFISNIAWIAALVIVGISVVLNFHRFYDNLVLVLLSIVAVPLVCFLVQWGIGIGLRKVFPSFNRSLLNKIWSSSNHLSQKKFLRRLEQLGI